MLSKKALRKAGKQEELIPILFLISCLPYSVFFSPANVSKITHQAMRIAGGVAIARRRLSNGNPTVVFAS
jgi:hypothetical protein